MKWWYPPSGYSLGRRKQLYHFVEEAHEATQSICGRAVIYTWDIVLAIQDVRERHGWLPICAHCEKKLRERRITL